MALVLVCALLLQAAARVVFGFNHRLPHLVALAVAAIGLRWGSVAGAYIGALGGLLSALYSGGTPFAATAALTATGWLAGEIPERFVVESHRAVALSIMLASLLELAIGSLLRGVPPAGGTNAAIWVAGWAVILGPLIHGLIVRLSTAPPTPRPLVEPE